MGKIDRAALRQKIQQLEGLSDDERAALLELAATKRYGLVWEEREEAVEERLREELPVLIEDKDLALLDGGKEAPNHILIEGDNLEALTTLSYTHEGKVDVIYIDPPYNTGNKDFVYNDSFVDSEDSYRHSKWLSFMSKRLRIAKRLLSDRGVIFISIDDNEQANLKLLCDEVFGERNLVAMITNITGAHQSGEGVLIQKNVEYCVVYAHNIDTAKIVRVDKTEESYRNLNDAPTPLATRLDMGYTIYYEPTSKDMKTEFDYNKDAVSANTIESVYKDNKELVAKGYIPVRPGFRNGKLHRWRWGVDTFNERKDEIVMFNTNRGLVPKFKQCGFNAPKNIIEFPGGAIDLKKIFGEDSPFDYPKSVSLIQYLCSIATDTNSTVLDFFAGSGTTLHAVMQLNKEDGGKRQCILVTNNENNICREVTYERNRRVIEGYTTPKGTQVEGMRENNLRYYRTQLLSRERTNRNMRRLVAASTDLLCIKEGIFDEFQVSGFKFQARDARLFSDGERAMMVIYNEEVIPEVVEWIGGSDGANGFIGRNGKIKVYVFSPGAYAWDDDFAEVIDRVELCALPEAIYQAYKSVLPKKKVRRETAEGSPKEGGEE